MPQQHGESSLSSRSTRPPRTSLWTLLHFSLGVFLMIMTGVRGQSMPSGHGYGRGASSTNNCKTMCPRIVLPSPQDFEQTKNYQIERELHGGPFGVDTMNPFYQAPETTVAGHPWTGLKRPVVSMMLPGTFPLTGFLEVESMLKQEVQRQQRQELQASTQRFGTVQKNHFYKIKQHFPRPQNFNKHAPCYHICQTEGDPRAEMDPFGGL